MAGHQGLKPHNGHAPTSEFVGVSWCERAGGWRMDIAKDHHKFYIHFGSTPDDELEAALAYNDKATELYGQKARLN